MTESEQVTGGILAGGRGQRMGGLDKGLMLHDGRELVAHMIERLRPQVAGIVLSANRNLDRYRAFGYPVHADDHVDFSGPLAGIARLLQACPTEFLMTVPCDTPAFPQHLAELLLARQHETGADVVVVHDGEQRQFLFALYRRDLAASARDALGAGERAVWRWQEDLNLAEAHVDGGPAAFANLNTRADL
ncbi:MAG: molybdenum cofactor guanylyltransferase [Xanthomonadales bacterium]|nr:molybdenum cofactor guanylyltransferase [Xanthomonadales bacterium]MBK7144751.1 molybdenum cofactor guanylyltransferase [Xanthomonadales bacterium]MCC6562165.1 molybdenum cofactor guanylyltransferase [Xanthomonadales bacterium]